MSLLVRIFLMLSAFWLAACSGLGGDEAAPAMSADPVASNRIKTGDPLTGDHDQRKIQEKYGSYSGYTKGKDGKSLGEDKEFGGFDRQNAQFKGDFQGKTYKGGDYKRSAWGDKDYVTKVYGGKTDGSSLRKNSRFGSKTAGENTMMSRDSGRGFQTNNFSTTAAREEGRGNIGRPSDSETDVRRRVFTEPDIMPWNSQGMTVEDTNRMMGR